VTVAASRFVTVQDVLWSQVGAISTLIIVPPILFTVLLRRRIVEGLVGDSVKG
jgi:ABC-type glycerol-3-phosphate transport system permease component